MLTFNLYVALWVESASSIQYILVLYCVQSLTLARIHESGLQQLITALDLIVLDTGAFGAS